MRVNATRSASMKSREGNDRDPQRFSLTLASHVYVCATGDGSVILDLKRDKYLGIGKEESKILSKLIVGWPVATRRNGATAACSKLEIEIGIEVETETERAQGGALCRSLATQGLVVPVGHGCERVRRPLTDMRREWISVGDELEVEVHVTWRHVANFVRSYLWARFSLALMSLKWTVGATQKRKARCEATGELMNVLAVAALVGAFRMLRPFVFAAEGRCLLHALVLVRFLSRYGYYPEWVIGVATQPWAAHSWVQWGDFLLDSNPEKVCRYTPILVV
jgi:hypothetical protein